MEEYCYRFKLWAAYNGNTPEKQKKTDKNNIPYMMFINEKLRGHNRRSQRDKDYALEEVVKNKIIDDVSNEHPYRRSEVENLYNSLERTTSVDVITIRHKLKDVLEYSLSLNKSIEDSRKALL